MNNRYMIEFQSSGGQWVLLRSTDNLQDALAWVESHEQDGATYRVVLMSTSVRYVPVDVRPSSVFQYYSAGGPDKAQALEYLHVLQEDIPEANMRLQTETLTTRVVAWGADDDEEA